jgi:hypothetical protein
MSKYVVASWPGVESVEGLSCTHSLGISPSSIQLMIHPQDRVPAESGNLVFGDGDEQVTLRDCKLDRIRSSTSGEGKTWTLDILDRRWKWQFGSIYGWYNQLDRHAKLIPWTIRSPRELAILCLQAMGETNYDIDMPTGLVRADGENHGLLNPPWLGVAATTGTNPPVHWNGEPPALALDRLCQQFGRIVVWQWKSNRVLITRPGIGKALPDGSLYQESPSFDSPETPTGGAIHGAPTKYQVRLALEAVGEEWDGSYWPIDQLSYAPLAPGAVQIIRVRCYPFAGDRFQIILNSPDPTNPRAGAVFEVTAPASPTATGVLTSFKNAINVQGLNNRIDGVITASMDGDQLVLTGLRMGDAWSCHVSVYRNAGTDGRIHQRLVQAAVRQTASWRFSFPKEYPGVRATDRLTLSEARALAQKSVWRCYRLSALDPNGRPIRIPNDSSDTSIRLDGAVDVIATTDGSQDAINEVIVDTASLDAADVVVDAGIEAGDDGSADVITTDATDATPPLPPFPPCTLNLGGGAALADVNVQGANSSAEKMRIISDGREEYRVGPHIFRLLRTNNILPALAVLSGDGRSEMSFDARLGAQAVYSASVFTVQDRIPNCAVNIEGEPCLTRLLDALQCEEVKTTPLSGCPPVIGFTYEGQKTIHESIGAGRKLILSVIGNCPL